MGRAPCCEKVGLKKGRWTAEEDQILAKYIQANGEGSWRSLPKNAGLLRCGKSCRLRWINYLRADLKRGNISAEEENTIVKLHTSFGNRWSLIASHLPGRTDNEIKNYWNSHLSRKIYNFPRIESQPGTGTGTGTGTGAGAGADAGVMDTSKVGIGYIPPKRKGGRTSRWAMKKNKSYTQTQKVNDTTQKSFLQQKKSDATVPPPPTPSLESEALPKVDEKCYNSVDGIEKSNDNVVLGLCELEDINEGSGALGLSDMLETCGVWDLSEERESNDPVEGDACPNKTASSDISLNGESGEWYSCSSVALDFDQHWNWESLIEFNNVAESEACNNWEHQDQLLTWLWEDDDWESHAKKLGETDPQIQNDMIDWFLS